MLAYVACNPAFCLDTHQETLTVDVDHGKEVLERRTLRIKTNTTPEIVILIEIGPSGIMGLLRLLPSTRRLHKAEKEMMS